MDQKPEFNVAKLDYLEYLKTLPNKSIDLICIDPPYGKIKGMQLSGQKKKIDWDQNIDWAIMFAEFKRVLKDGGTMDCFGQNPTYAQMILANLKEYKYELIWIKNNAAQGFHSDKMPLNFTENIAVFVHNESRDHKRTFNNIALKTTIDQKDHFCRWYAQQLFEWIGIKRRKIHEQLGHRKLEFFFCYTGKHFGLLSENLYNELIDVYKINQWKHFIPFSKLKQKWNSEKEQTKGIKLESAKYSQTLSNVLHVNKENEYLHPTQKPVELMEKLIMMFSNEGDNVLDCFMGSGSTAVAALKLNRNFYGCEIQEEYYQTSLKRIEKITLK